jgi:hypothetical protein
MFVADIASQNYLLPLQFLFYQIKRKMLPGLQSAKVWDSFQIRKKYMACSENKYFLLKFGTFPNLTSITKFYDEIYAIQISSLYNSIENKSVALMLWCGQFCQYK